MNFESTKTDQHLRHRDSVLARHDAKLDKKKKRKETERERQIKEKYSDADSHRGIYTDWKITKNRVKYLYEEFSKCVCVCVFNTVPYGSSLQYDRFSANRDDMISSREISI